MARDSNDVASNLLQAKAEGIALRAKYLTPQPGQAPGKHELAARNLERSKAEGAALRAKYLGQSGAGSIAELGALKELPPSPAE